MKANAHPEQVEKRAKAARLCLVAVSTSTEVQKEHFIKTVIVALMIHIVVIASSFQMPVNKQKADQPSPRADQNSMIAHQQLLEKTRNGRIDIYFEGDSITRRWGTSDEQYKHFLANWRENFFGWNAANFGWGGDTTQNILWRLNNGELDGVTPSVIVVMAGPNTVSKPLSESEDARAADIARGVKAIVERCRQKAP